MQTFKRFCRHDILFINEDITKSQLNQIETYADRLFKANYRHQFLNKQRITKKPNFLEWHMSFH